MREIKKLLATALAATTLLAALAATSSAREFQFSNQRQRVVFRPLIFTSGETRLSCTVTLEGSFHYRTFRKVEGSLIGYATRAIVDAPGCRSTGLGTNIRARALTETLPWHVRYVSFTGTLPAVTIRVRLNNGGFDLINVPIIGTCKYRANIDGIVGGPRGREINENGRETTLKAGEEIEVPGSGFCPTGRFGTGPEPVLLLETTTRITVTLI